MTLKRSAKVMLTSDKPVYQPGQVIYVRALALRQPDLHPLTDQPATFSVLDPKGNVVFKQQGKTSRYGISAADCPLDSEILEGAYTILGKVGDVESRLTVEVKKYVLPKFKVALKLDKPFYRPGDVIKFTVQADYFFTKPVAGAEVDVEADLSEELPGRPPPISLAAPTPRAPPRLRCPYRRRRMVSPAPSTFTSGRGRRFRGSEADHVRRIHRVLLAGANRGDPGGRLPGAGRRTRSISSSLTSTAVRRGASVSR